MQKINIRKAKEEDSDIISDICRVTFESSLKQYYSFEGIKYFMEKTDPKNIKKRICNNGMVYVIESEGIPFGSLELIEGHIVSLLFIVSPYQRKGYATQMFNKILDNEEVILQKTQFIAVNAPSSVSLFFSNLGFKFEGAGHADAIKSDIGPYHYMRFYLPN